MDGAGRYVELWTLLYMVNTKDECSSLFSPHTTSNTSALPVTSQQVVAGSPRLPASLDRSSSAPAPCPTPGTSWSEQAPVLAPLLKLGHGDINTSAAECEAPRPLCKLHFSHK